jgi:Protein of unknown function (DUF2726)
MTETALIGVGAAGLMLALWWVFAASRTTSGESEPFVLPSGVTLSSAPLLTEGERSLYSLIRMAVQDHYLVFAQVPLWSFVSVEAMGKARSYLLNRMALKRVDFALVHPGSGLVEQVVLIEEESPRPHQIERQRVMELVLDAAGIVLVTVRPKHAYTVPDLAALLGLAAEE